jgi:DNA-binding NtrC family response regulator
MAGIFQPRLKFPSIWVQDCLLQPGQQEFSEMAMKEDVLITFTGFHDPYSLGLVDEEEQPGPILTLVRERPFARIILFSTPNTSKNSEGTRAAIESQFRETEVEVLSLPLDDPTDYAAIMSLLRKHLKELRVALPRATFYVSVASGTPQMHACWVVLLQEGEFPARILHVRPSRFVTADRPLVTEVDLERSLGIPFALDQRMRTSEPDVMYQIVPPSASEARDFAASAPVIRQRVVQPDLPHSSLDIARTKLGIVGDHPKMAEVLERVEVAAPTDMSVLILGETGTGKELVARLIHNMSDRSTAAFVPLNCGAIPKELIESTLFGHTKGAFTGATRDQAGKFAEADGGTLFLDELGELLPETQVKLLRVIEDGIIQPIGAKSPKSVDVRVVAATNQDLYSAVSKGSFREDLFYRLNTVQLSIPPLRDRASDIPKIALHLLEDINGRLRRPKRFSRDALTRLQRYPWLGNVRDLRNALTRTAMFCKKEVIEADDLIIADPITKPEPLDLLPEPSEGFDLNGYLNSVRKQLFLRALELADGNQSGAARLLGVTPQAVHKFVNDKGE